MNAKLFFPAIALYGLILVSCSDDTINSDAVSDTLKSGNWKVTYFFDTNQDLTSGLDAYVFVFADIGQVTANNGSEIISGAWSASENTDDDVIVNLSFEPDATIDALNATWHVVERTDDKIRMDDMTGAGTDYLTIEKQ